jgi:hypothetical protein
MSRLSAWIASRRQSRRSARAHHDKPAGTAARPLGFERYEERIALSTNAAIEFAPVEPLYVVDYIDAKEGGWIAYSGDFSNHVFLNMSGSTAYSMKMTRADNAYFGGFTTLDADGSAGLSTLWSAPTSAGFNYGLADGGESPCRSHPAALVRTGRQ